MQLTIVAQGFKKIYIAPLVTLAFYLAIEMAILQNALSSNVLEFTSSDPFITHYPYNLRIHKQAPDRTPNEEAR